MTNDPKWWKPEHTSTWDRVKSALQRDWEQTKADVSSGGQDLDQSVTDTVKQAVGAEPIPPEGQRNPDWSKAENSVRYGVGAREQYGSEHKDWDDRLEAKLKEEWMDLKDGTTWDEAKSFVQRGWNRVTK